MPTISEDTYHLLLASQPKYITIFTTDAVLKAFQYSLSLLAEERPTFGQILSMLDDVVVEALIHDDMARIFWKSKLMGKIKLPWKVCAEPFCLSGQL